LVAFVAGQAVLVFVRERESDASGGNSINPTLTIFSNILWAMGLCGVIIVGMNLWTYARRRGLQRRFPGATVLDGYSSPLLKRTINSFERHEPGRIDARMPGLFAILIDAEGFSFWTSARAETPMFFEPWSRVTSVSIREIVRERSRDYAIVLEVPCGAGAVEIPLVVTGTGLFATSTLKRRGLAKLAEKIESFISETGRTAEHR
jgi:hypothetical protein